MSLALVTALASAAPSTVVSGFSLTWTELGFGATVLGAAVATILVLLVLTRIAAFVLPRLIQALVVIGSLILVSGVLGAALILLHGLFQAFQTG
jgi:hypothetical protein